MKQELAFAGLKLQNLSSAAQLREVNKMLNDAKVLYKEVFRDLDEDGINDAVVNDLLREVSDDDSLEVLLGLSAYAPSLREPDRDYGLLNTLYGTLRERAPTWGRGNPFM